MHPAVEYRLRWFAYDHLPERLQKISKPFSELAHKLSEELEGIEVTAALDKLWEAKNLAVVSAARK